jgi:hypothetical protein
MGFLLLGQPLAAGRPFTDADGNQYAANALRVLTEAQKAAIGITWQPDSEPIDHRFYWDRDTDGNLIPKRLEDEPAVDENGDPVLDEAGEQIINKGLKSEWIAGQKYTAGTLLASTDWYIVRKAENDTAIPAAVLAYREAVRTTSGIREAEIAACTTTEELAALLTNPAQVYDEATDSMVANTEPFITPFPEQD